MTNQPVQTDWGSVHTGLRRTVDFNVESHAPSPTEAYVIARACSRSDDNCRWLGFEYLSLEAGETAALQFEWDGVGSVGDMRVDAIVCPDYGAVETDSANNSKSTRHYVVAGGTGFGLDPLGYPSYYDYEFNDC